MPGRAVRPAQGSRGARPKRVVRVPCGSAHTTAAERSPAAGARGAATTRRPRSVNTRRAGRSASTAHGVSAACGAVAGRGRRQPIAVVRRACERERTAPGDRRDALLASSPMHILIGVHVLAVMASSFPVIVLLVPIRHDVHAPGAVVVVVEAALQFEVS